MQNNGQALADLQKTPKPVSQNRDSKTVRGAKRLWKKFKRDLFVRLGRNLENIYLMFSLFSMECAPQVAYRERLGRSISKV